ncbi:MAG: hypothetical protein QXK78_00705 [Candidatus Bathyarchaeia archaeon]
MDVILKHIIGTLALIGLVITVGLAYTTTASYVEMEVAKVQLKQIAEHVSLNLIEVISLVSFANYPSRQIKGIDLPTDIGGKAYMVKLMVKEGKCYVRAELATEVTYTESLIPIKPDEDIKFLTEVEFIQGENGEIYSGIIYGGNSNTFVWAELMRPNGEIIAGLGWRKIGG